MGATLERWQVLIYVVALVAGAVIGLAAPASASGFEFAVTPLLVAVLYATFLGVPFESLGRAVRDVRFMLAIVVVNFVVAPVVAFGLTRFVSYDDALVAGILLVLLAPCVDYVIVFTRLAGGAHERLLAATPLLMLLQLILLPVYLLLFAGAEVADAIEPSPFIEAFVWMIVVPLAAAILTQLAARRLTAAASLVRGASTAMVPLMAATLLAVVASHIDVIREHSRELTIVALIFAVFLAVMPLLGRGVAAVFRESDRRARAVMFSGATRNSLVVLPLALVLGEQWSIVPAIVVTQTLIELIGMVVLVRAVPTLVR